MATSYNLLHLPFPKTLTLTLTSSTRPLSLSTRPLSLSTRRPPPAAAAASGAPMEPAGSINPALASANILYFRSGYNVQIVVDEGEPEEVLLRRFRREVSKVGVIHECRRRRYFENTQEEKKRKQREAGRRNRRR